MNSKTREDHVAELQSHILQFADWFNEASAKEHIGITLDPANVIKSLTHISDTRLHDQLVALSNNKVSKEQVMTAVSAIAQIIRNPGNSVLILREEQPSKFDTTFLILFAGPIHYLKSRVRYSPLFMTTNRIIHLTQTRNAMRRFFNLYGDISIISDCQHEGMTDQRAHLAPVISDGNTETTLFDYIDDIAEEVYPGGDYLDSILERMVVKYPPGKLAEDVGSYCQRASQRGQEVMLVVEESRIPTCGVDDKPGKKPPCPLSRALATLNEEFFSPRKPNFMVGFAQNPAFAKVSTGDFLLVNEVANHA